ncbi:hypothetical protein ACFL3V_04605, partial [Nanoarchaeota archaeon]
MNEFNGKMKEYLFYHNRNLVHINPDLLPNIFREFHLRTGPERTRKGRTREEALERKLLPLVALVRQESPRELAKWQKSLESTAEETVFVEGYDGVHFPDGDTYKDRDGKYTLRTRDDNPLVVSGYIKRATISKLLRNRYGVLGSVRLGVGPLNPNLLHRLHRFVESLNEQFPPDRIDKVTTNLTAIVQMPEKITSAIKRIPALLGLLNEEVFQVFDRPFYSDAVESLLAVPEFPLASLKQNYLWIPMWSDEAEYRAVRQVELPRKMKELEERLAVALEKFDARMDSFVKEGARPSFDLPDENEEGNGLVVFDPSRSIESIVTVDRDLAEKRDSMLNPRVYGDSKKLRKEYGGGIIGVDCYQIGRISELYLNKYGIIGYVKLSTTDLFNTDQSTWAFMRAPFMNRYFKAKAVIEIPRSLAQRMKEHSGLIGAASGQILHLPHGISFLNSPTVSYNFHKDTENPLFLDNQYLWVDAGIPEENPNIRYHACQMVSHPYLGTEIARVEHRVVNILRGLDKLLDMASGKQVSQEEKDLFGRFQLLDTE